MLSRASAMARAISADLGKGVSFSIQLGAVRFFWGEFKLLNDAPWESSENLRHGVLEMMAKSRNEALMSGRGFAAGTGLPSSNAW